MDNEVVKAGMTALLLLMEWWIMQPYHEPVFAKMWHYIAAFSRYVAQLFGRLALNAENNYYVAAEAGI